MHEYIFRQFIVKINKILVNYIQRYFNYIIKMSDDRIRRFR